ncbi:MAG: CocE/NonD family hydrolase [Acidimicrobiia bacterium]
MRRTGLVLLLATSLVAAACSGGDDTADPAEAADTTTNDTTTTEVVPSPTGATTPDPAPSDDTDEVTTGEIAAGFELIEPPATIRPGVEQIAITGAEPGTDVRVVAAGIDLATIDELDTIDLGEALGGTVDELGSLLVRGIDSGSDVRLVFAASGITEPYDILARDEHPDPAFYAEQRLPTEGLGYITTRDGTTLSASVWLPGPVDAGPYPTVVEYSGYTPSDPESAGFPDLFTAMGYAYVGVNIRGTGCSGGSFRYFEYVQSLDGYDVIETVAAQPWVRDDRVGMVGVSYPGISQLFVAQTQPPSLAAITPFSVLADSSISTLYPGGILNTGFAVPWTAERIEQAQPNGQQWAVDRIAAGDATCEANQQLRLQNPDLLAEITDNAFWTDDVAAEIAPRLFVDRITVPTFVAGAWQDEQTGGHFPTMLDRFTGTDRLYVSLMNGLHTESISPGVFPRFVEFLDLYVGERTPSLATARTIAPILAGGIFGTSDVALPDTDRFDGVPYEEALAVFESEPAIEVLFEQGAADGLAPLTPLPRFRASFDAWPVPDATAERWYLAGDGVEGGLLGDEPGDVGETTTYLALPDAVPPTWYEGSSSAIWRTDVTYDWQEGGAGTFGAWATSPLPTDTVVVGSGSVDLWLQSNLGDTDLEVTISEIRPDGQELYVQSGWLRASNRTLAADETTELRPVHTHREADAAPLPAGEFELVRVEIFPFAHAFRAGSRIRLTVDAPGGNRPVWVFDTIAGGEQVTIAHDAAFPSSLVLPVVAGVDVPADYPACDSYRGQPCRPFTG